MACGASSMAFTNCVGQSPVPFACFRTLIKCVNEGEAQGTVHGLYVCNACVEVCFVKTSVILLVFHGGEETYSVHCLLLVACPQRRV